MEKEICALNLSYIEWDKKGMKLFYYIMFFSKKIELAVK